MTIYRINSELHDIRVRLQQIVRALSAEREVLNNLYVEIGPDDVVSRYIPAHQQLPKSLKDNSKEKAYAMKIKRIRNKCELSAAQCVETIDLLTEALESLEGIKDDP